MLTLAQFVQACRFAEGITQEKLAETAGLPLQYIQDVEAGIELILSPSIRQKLGRSLKVAPSRFLQFNARLYQQLADATSQSAIASSKSVEQLKQSINNNPTGCYNCPQGENNLVIRVFERRYLEENELFEIKIHCSKCLFRCSV